MKCTANHRTGRAVSATVFTSWSCDSSESHKMPNRIHWVLILRQSLGELPRSPRICPGKQLAFSVPRERISLELCCALWHNSTILTTESHHSTETNSSFSGGDIWPFFPGIHPFLDAAKHCLLLRKQASFPDQWKSTESNEPDREVEGTCMKRSPIKCVMR
jgi:hypothetical protein